MKFAVLLSLLLGTASLLAQSDSEFHGVAGVRATGLAYSPEAEQERLGSGGVFLDMDFKSHGGFKFSFDSTAIDYRTATRKQENQGSFSGRFYLPLEEVPGKLIFRVDGLRANYQEASGVTRNLRATGFHVGYLSDLNPVMASFYLDLGFTLSNYQTGLQVDQWTPTLGFGLNDNYDWISLSLDHTTLRSALVPDWKEPHTSYQLGWSHFLKPGMALKPRSLRASLQLGEQVYGVDSEGGVANTLGHTQKGRWSVGLAWKGTSGVGFSLDGGQAQFKHSTTTVESVYVTNFLSTTLTFSW